MNKYINQYPNEMAVCDFIVGKSGIINNPKYPASQLSKKTLSGDVVIDLSASITFLNQLGTALNSITQPNKPPVVITPIQATPSPVKTPYARPVAQTEEFLRFARQPSLARTVASRKSKKKRRRGSEDQIPIPDLGPPLPIPENVMEEEEYQEPTFENLSKELFRSSKRDKKRDRRRRSDSYTRRNN